MTYASNIERLKANANANLTARKDNLDQTIRNIEKKEEEDIDNLQKGEELLIGGGVSAFARGYTGKPFTEEGDGLIPTLYGERIARKHKEGIEASKSERARLLKQREKEIKEYTEFAAQVDSNKRIDTKLFDGKYKMLLNGGLYEKGSLYTRLSPAAQWAFAQHRIGLFNQSIQDKVWHSMSKDETPLPVPGMPGKTYTPKGVHLDDAMPMLLKENAINETIELTDKGSVRVAFKKDGAWSVNQWVKKAILLSFKINKMKYHFEFERLHNEQIKTIFI